MWHPRPQSVPPSLLRCVCVCVCVCVLCFLLVQARLRNQRLWNWSRNLHHFFFPLLAAFFFFSSLWNGTCFGLLRLRLRPERARERERRELLLLLPWPLPAIALHAISIGRDTERKNLKYLKSEKNTKSSTAFGKSRVVRIFHRISCETSWPSSTFISSVSRLGRKKSPPLRIFLGGRSPLAISKSCREKVRFNPGLPTLQKSIKQWPIKITKPQV